MNVLEPTQTKEDFSSLLTHPLWCCWLSVIPVRLSASHIHVEKLKSSTRLTAKQDTVLCISVCITLYIRCVKTHYNLLYSNKKCFTFYQGCSKVDGCVWILYLQKCQQQLFPTEATSVHCLFVATNMSIHELAPDVCVSVFPSLIARYFQAGWGCWQRSYPNYSHTSTKTKTEAWVHGTISMAPTRWSGHADGGFESHRTAQTHLDITLSMCSISPAGTNMWLGTIFVSEKL